jgi:GTP pyrophosphokinase
MNEIAEKGYAAYWKYRNKDHVDAGLDEWLIKTRELLTESDEEAIAFINDFKKNLYAEEIVVFTPEGEMVNLPAEATVLDFAYSIHTDLGNHCIGANVNKRLVPVNYQVKSGDQVEIITSRVQQPSEDWFKYVVTARAKSRIKNAIRNVRRKHRKEGQEKLENYLKQLKLENTKPIFNKLLAASNLKSPVDYYYYIDTEKIVFKDVRDVLQPQDSIVNWMRNIRFPFVRPKSPVDPVPEVDSPAQKSETDLKNNNKEEFTDLEYSVSKCCNPIPGDNVIGLIFPNEPIQIHQTNCEVAIRLMSQYGKNIVKAKWKQKEGITFLAGLKIQAVDKIGFIQHITSLIAEEFQLNIRTFNLESNEGLIDLSLTLYVNSTERLKKLIQQLRKIKEVIKVTRLDKFA